MPINTNEKKKKIKGINPVLSAFARDRKHVSCPLAHLIINTKSGAIKISLIGRVNVGKSTLFNKIIGEERALVSKIAGTTRDRNYAETEWNNKKFTLIDAGGFFDTKMPRLGKKIQPQNPQEIINEEVKKNIIKAIGESSLVIFITDARGAANPIDREIAKFIKQEEIPYVFVLNKVDSPRDVNVIFNQEYLTYGLGAPIPISAVSGLGIGDLLDAITKKLGPQKNKEEEKTTIRSFKLAIVGKPNVGKSSLVNYLLKEERVIVSPVPHTTREPQDSLLADPRGPILLIDTVGIRKKSKIKLDVERLGVKRSLKIIERTDVVILLVDINEPIGHQEKALAEFAVSKNKGLIIAVNKIDLLKENIESTMKQKILYYQVMLPMAWWAPIIFISIKTGKNIDALMDLAWQVKKNREHEFDRETLEKAINQIARKTDNEKLKKCELTQVATHPPKLIIQIPKKMLARKLINPAQFNMIEKYLREKDQLWGTPINIYRQDITNY